MLVPLLVHVTESPALIVSSLGLSECVPSIEMTGPLAAAVSRRTMRRPAASGGVAGGAVGIMNELSPPPPLSVGADDPPPPHALATTRTNTAAEPASKRIWLYPYVFQVVTVQLCPGSSETVLNPRAHY